MHVKLKVHRRAVTVVLGAVHPLSICGPAEIVRTREEQEEEERARKERERGKRRLEFFSVDVELVG